MLKTCCFFGHRKIKKTEELENRVGEVIENIIVNDGIDVFLFGSRSEFDDLCYKIVTRLKEKYLHIKRVYVRAEYPDLNEAYENYLLGKYEVTYFPQNIRNSGRAVYIERNFEMIEKSNFCIIYYDDNYIPIKRIKNNNIDRSGTKIAYEFAKATNKIIYNVYK